MRVHIAPAADPASVILVADADILIRTVIAHLITQLQGIPILVADGAAALAVVQTYGATLSGAILDVVMPHTSGIGVAAAIQQQGLIIPIILMRGAISSPQIENLRTLPEITVLPKPFALADLHTLVQRMLPASEPSDGQANHAD